MKIDKNLIQRTISGAILVALIIGAILLNVWSFLFIFLIITLLSIREFHQLTNSKQIQTSLVGSMLGAFLLFLWLFFDTLPPGIIRIDTQLLASLFMVLYGFWLMVMIIIELFLKRPNPINNWAYLLLGQLYVALPFSLLINVLFISGEWKPIWLLSIFIIIWVNDTFAYVTGTLLGKHRMFERISPKKSWEGFIGGALFALLAGCIFAYFEPSLMFWQWLIISQIVVIFGTLGDLIESLIKRTVNKKDSGHLIPGHGGLLDRFDSMLLAAPAVCLFLYVTFLF